MAEYIEREALLAELEDEIDFVIPFYNAEQNQYFTMGLRCAYRDAQRFPAADVVEVRHGKWIKTYPDNRLDGDYYCSNCYAGVDIATGEETPIDRELYYCPNCGAKMDGKVCDDK